MSAPEPISAAERKRLRGLAMSLKPAVNVGRAGVSASVVSETAAALARDELVKLRFQGGSREETDAAVEAILAATGATLVGRIGHTASIWKRKPQPSSSSSLYLR